MTRTPAEIADIRALGTRQQRRARLQIRIRCLREILNTRPEFEDGYRAFLGAEEEELRRLNDGGSL